MQRLSDILNQSGETAATLTGWRRRLLTALCVIMIIPFDLTAALARTDSPEAAAPSVAAISVAPATDTIPVRKPIPPGKTQIPPDSTAYLDAEMLVREPLDGEYDEQADTVPTVVVDENSPYGLDGKKIFNPSPTRAVWLSALFPGLGQVYNRRYWKLPIIVGAFMGLGYGTNWNNGQLRDYSQAYRDLMDNDPSTKSYMNFFPSTTKEEDLDKEWLTNTMRTRRDFYRRNRDLCIICLVGMYMLCMVDAYVDASLAHFDISPDLSIDWSPSMIVNPTDRKVSVGLNWALTF